MGAWGSRAKKKTLRASEQAAVEVQEERRCWREAIAGIAPERLVFLDESAALTNLVRSHAWSPRGARAHGAAPYGHWERVTLLGALGREGMLAAMSIAAATDGAVFQAWLEQVLLPELRRVKPDAVIVMDNLAAHKTRAVRRRLGLRLPLSAALCPRSEPDRAGLGQGQGAPAQGRGAHGRRPPRRVRPSAGRRHAARRPGLLPPCRLCPSQLSRGLL